MGPRGRGQVSYLNQLMSWVSSWAALLGVEWIYLIRRILLQIYFIEKHLVCFDYKMNGLHYSLSLSLALYRIELYIFKAELLL